MQENKTVEKEFAGEVIVYDSKIYIDTRDGTGYKQVIEKLKPLIYKFSKKFRFSGNDPADTQQDITVLILDGIKKFNPTKETKLSTFIEMYVKQKLINCLRDQNREFRDATFLNVRKFMFKCSCGYNFVHVVSPEETCPLVCKNCGNDVPLSNKTVAISCGELNYSDTIRDDYDTDTHIEPENKDCFGPTLFNNKETDTDSLDFECDIKNWIKTSDPRLTTMIEMCGFGDSSVSAASLAVGLTSAGGDAKLKSLSRNKIIKKIFGR